MASTIGEILRQARRGRGETLSDAARHTGVRATHLAALERDELHVVGDDPDHVRGIVRSYAEHLGLDVASVLHEYPAGNATDTRPRAATHDAGREPARRSRRAVATLVGAALLAVVVAGATVFVLRARGGDEVATTDAARGAEATAPAATASRATSASEGSTRDPRLLDIPQGATPETLRMKLEFTDEVWVRVIADGETKLEGIMRPGAVTEFTADRRFELRLGRAEAVTFSLNGAYYDNIASDRRGAVDVTCTIDASCRVVQEG
jgi:cytoskeletal protein RodZ